MSNTMEDTTAKIRELNDQLRKTLSGGKLLLTGGIAGREDVWEIVARVAAFADFDSGSDPHREHDFGAFESGGDTIFWKIDCYDVSFEYASPDPTNPSVTRRVLTIMRADEY